MRKSLSFLLSCCALCLVAIVGCGQSEQTAEKSTEGAGAVEEIVAPVNDARTSVTTPTPAVNKVVTGVDYLPPTDLPIHFVEPMVVATTPVSRELWQDTPSFVATTAIPDKVTPSVSVERRIGFAPSPSPFVVVDSLVADTRDGSKKGTVYVDDDGLLPFRWSLSSTGKFFAYESPSKFRFPVVTVVQCADGTTVGAVDCLAVGQNAISANYTINFFAFTQADLLLVVASTGRESGLFLWDIKKQKLVRQYPAAKVLGTPGSLAMSGNGQYFVANAHNELIMFDMVKGEAIGRMAAPTCFEQRIPHLGLKCLAFSRGGKELAGMYDLQTRERAIVVWDLAGKIVDEIVIVGSNTAGRPDALSWMNDDAGWMIGNGDLVDRKSKQLVWSARGMTSFSIATLVDEDCCVLFRKTWNGKFELLTLRLPFDEIARARTADSLPVLRNLDLP